MSDKILEMQKRINSSNTQRAAALRASGNERLIEKAARILAQANPDTDLLSDLVEAGQLEDWNINHQTVRTIIADFYPNWVHVPAIQRRNDNLLHEPVSTRWEEGYKNFVARFLVKNGTPVRVTDTTYGWEEEGKFANSHPGDTIVAVFNVQEDRWSNFQDSFTENSECHGVTAEVVYRDGNTRQVRYEASLPELLAAAFQA